jgi:excisionase family DNA binding protein
VSERFEFTVTEAARLLGKSPVTLRKWERQGVVHFRRIGNDRRLDTTELRALIEDGLQIDVLILSD